MSSYCPICIELKAEAGTRLSAALGDQSVRNAILMNSDSFAVIPSVGPLALGHSLIVTKSHQCSLFGRLTPSEYEQIESLLAQFFANLVERIDSNLEILCFEHGALSALPNKELCSTVHAHLHLVPMPRPNISQIISSVGGEELVSVKPRILTDVIQRFREYLLVFAVRAGSEITSPTIQDASQMPSQFMRQLVAENIEAKDWDWKKNSDGFLLRQTIDLGFRLNTCCLSINDQAL